jgi:hypothetical protein
MAATEEHTALASRTITEVDRMVANQSTNGESMGLSRCLCPWGEDRGRARVDRAASERAAHLVPRRDPLEIRPPTGSCTVVGNNVGRLRQTAADRRWCRWVG